jgi:hypothetical protein
MKKPRQAEKTVRYVNRYLGGGLGLACGAALKKRNWLLGAILGMFAVLSLLIGFGLFKEQE